MRAIAELYERGGISLLAIVALSITVVHLWRELRASHREQVRAERDHARTVANLLLRLKRAKNGNQPQEYTDEFDEPTGIVSIKDLQTRKRDAVRAFEAEIEAIGKMLRDKK